MRYLIKMSNYIKDEYIEEKIEAADVFDAINIAAAKCEDPSNTMLISAEPMDL